MTDDADNLLQLPGLEAAPVSPGVAVGALALNFAMKYHDIGTVKDGVLYQQYKLEQKTLIPLDLQMVFETAKQIEVHLLGASDRIAGLLVDAIRDGVLEEKRDAP